MAEHATSSSLLDTASRIRDVELDPHERAEFDQSTSEWRDAFAGLGLDLKTPGVAFGAFAMVQLLLFHFIDVSGDLESFGERMTDGAYALASFLP